MGKLGKIKRARKEKKQFQEGFMSLAPIYLVGSGYLFQAELDNPSSLTMALSIGFLVFASYLGISAFVPFPRKLMLITYKVASALGFVAAIIFLLDLLGMTADLYSAGANLLYVRSFYFVGTPLVIALMLSHLVKAYASE